MKQSINFSQFADAFRDHDRKENFSLEGLRALFDFLEDVDEQCETETELDVIALCCEFSEYNSAVDCITEAGYDFEPEETEPEETAEEALEYLIDRTMVITFDSGIIIQNF